MSGAEIDSQPLVLAETQRSEPKAKRGRFGGLEAWSFFLLAFVLCYAQTFWSGAPLLTLLFDSSGYLWVADGLQQCANSTTMQGICQYVSSGFSETARMALCHLLEPMADICKTGPVLPVITALCYALVGKSATSANWHVAGTLMCLLSAVVSPLLYLWGRRLGGPGTGRIAGLLAATYPAFLVNSGRLLSEIPALAICTAALFIASVVCESAIKRSRTTPSELSVLGLLGGGAIIGVCAGLIMMARPTLLLLPLILCATLPLWYKWSLSQQDDSAETNVRGREPKARLKPSMVVCTVFGVICGAAVSLAPWAACKTVLTGKPSITVDRYGAYNLYAGCNVDNDGWDILPSVYVNHPDQFKKSMSDVAASVVAEAASQPGEFVDLMLRKPGRMVAAPWNDFQISCLGAPWYLQRFWQQFLLLAAFFGFISIARDGVARKDSRLLVFAGVAGTAIAYHLINALFITMNRYFVVCMPLLLLSAARLLDDVIAGRVKNREVMMLALFLFPVISTAGAIALANDGTIASITGMFSALSFPAVFSVLITSALAISFFLGGSEYTKARFLRLPISIAMAAVTMCCLCSSRDFAAGLGTLVEKKAAEPITLVANNCNPGCASMRWFVVADLSGRTADNTVSVRLNDKQIGADWTPLWSRMPAGRENLSFLAAFAYSSGKRIEDFSQWSCLEVPASAVSNQTNVIALDSSAALLRGDLNDADHGNRTMSLAKFSWSKGFFADMPGEMRILEPARFSPDRASDLERMASGVVPRAFLVGAPLVESDETSTTYGNREFSPPPQVVTTAFDSRLKTVELTDLQFSTKDERVLVRVHVSGKVRTTKGSGDASVCVVEKVSTRGELHDELAAMAPQRIAAGPQWTSFQFDDFVPLSAGSRLESLRLLFAGRPWWEVLSYNSAKGRATLEFSDLRVTVTNASALDLTSAHVLPLAPTPSGKDSR